MDSKLVIFKYYQQSQPVVSNTQNTISGILNQLSSIFFTGTGQFANLGNIEQQDLIKTANLTFGNNTRISNYLNGLLRDSASSGYTSAQLVYLSLDTAFNLVEEKSGSLLATEEGILESLALENLEAKRDGFLYIFVANQPPHL